MSDISHLDFITSDYEQIVFKQQEKLEEVAAKEKRWDEGVMMAEWHLAKLPTQNASVFTPRSVTGLLANITVYAITGHKYPWMERVCIDMGWTPS